MTQSEHILRDTRAVLEMTFTLGDADGDVTYTVVDANGTSVASGTATDETEDGRYTFILAPQPEVATLTVTWTGTWQTTAQSLVTYVEIVGNHLFTVAEMRVFDNGAVASTTSYTDATIRTMRNGITDMFEEVCHTSFIPRYRRETLDGSNRRSLWLDRTPVIALHAASVGGVALTAPELATVTAYDYGKLDYPAYWTTGYRNVEVEYEHGLDAVPWQISQAALIYSRYLLVASDVSDRTISFSNELGTFRQAVPGRLYPTGLPTVDAALGVYLQPEVYV